ncbi:MAG: PEP-CTERM-box response regulator transcription factor [Geminicoccales bacterium]
MDKLLIVDDDPGILSQLTCSFAEYDVVIASAPTTAIDLFRDHRPKVVSLDLGLPPDADGSSVGLDLLASILALAPSTKIIVVSGNDDRSDALEAVTKGAWDYYEKPIDAEAFTLTVQRAFRVAALEAENQRLRTKTNPALPGIITNDQGMLAVCQMIEHIAPTSVNVLVLGESGTGKELLARAIHEGSPRVQQPFVAINCAAIPDTLLESELFGYEKGAFTSANRPVKGKIEAAHRGTLFLDEIGDLPFDLQAKLLRFLDERQVERLGGRTPIDVDVRIVSATHQPLLEQIEKGAFRQDLLHRLAGLTVKIPRLAERGDDILVLAQHFIDQFAAEHRRPAVRLGRDAKQTLLSHHWPGNVRELANTLQRAVILADDAIVTAKDLDLNITPTKATAGARMTFAGELISLREARDQAEKQAVDAAVKRAAGNLSSAAKLLGISRPTLYSLLRRHESLQPDAAADA